MDTTQVVGATVRRPIRGPYQVEVDRNEDGEVNGLDVDPFTDVILNGGTVRVIPEPSTCVLVIIGLVALAAWRTNPRRP